MLTSGRPSASFYRPPARPQTLTSFAGRVAPERALLDRERVSQLVTRKVLAWAGMGCMEGSLDRMLAEDAAEVSPASRALPQAGAACMQSEQTCEGARQCAVAWRLSAVAPLGAGAKPVQRTSKWSKRSGCLSVPHRTRTRWHC